MNKPEEKPTKLMVLSRLMSYWDKYPELRLCQIVSNAFRAHPDYRRNPEPEINDVYYMTDRKFLEALKILDKDESESKRTTQE